MSRATITALLLSFTLLHHAATATAQIPASLPAVPFSPTPMDCRILEEEFYVIITRLSAQIEECMHQKPQFGHVTNAGSCGIDFVAWSQCAYIGEQRCQVLAVRDREVAECKAQAEAIVAVSRAQEEREKELAKRLKAANTTMAAFSDTYNVLTRPESFLRKALGSQSDILKSIFPSRASGEPKSDRLDLVRELYTFAYNQARTGVSATPNPALRGIQSTILQELARQHQKLFSELENLNATLDRFAREMEQDHGGKPPVRSIPTTNNTSGECAVLQNETASRRLLDQNSDAWMQLFSRCQK